MMEPIELKTVNQLRELVAGWQVTALQQTELVFGRGEIICLAGTDYYDRKVFLELLAENYRVSVADFSCLFPADKTLYEFLKDKFTVRNLFGKQRIDSKIYFLVNVLDKELFVKMREKLGTFSQWEKVRLSLLLARLKEPDILMVGDGFLPVVLDEYLKKYTDENLRKKQTVILIPSHNRFLAMADRIYILHRGEILPVDSSQASAGPALTDIGMQLQELRKELFLSPGQIEQLEALYI